MGEREDLLAAVEARLEADDAWDDQDPLPAGVRPVLQARTLTEARQLAATLNGGDGDLDARSALGWLYLYRFRALPDGEDEDDLNAAIDMFTPLFITGSGGLPDMLLPSIAQKASHTALAMVDQSARAGDPDLADRAVMLWRRIVAATPDGEPARAIHLNDLGYALQNRFRCLGEPSDLDDAIGAHRAAAVAAPADEAERAAILSNLGAVLQTRFVRSGSLQDLDDAVEAHHAAVTTGGPDPGMYLNNLAVALQSRFERLGSLADLDDAINAFHGALAAPPAPSVDTAAVRSNLGSALRARFDRSGRRTDLEDAIEILQASATATPPAHPSLCLRLNNLGISLQARFNEAGAISDLNAAIEALQAAVATTPHTHPNLGMHLSNLGSALQNRFEQTAARADLDAAIQAMYEAAAALPAGHASLPGCLSNLAIALNSRYHQQGALADLDAAIDACRTAAAAIPAKHPGSVHPLTTLGSLLLARFNRAGAETDLDAAVEAHQAAVAATPVGHHARIRFLNNLGTGIYNRFLLTGAPDDLDSAVEIFRDAVATIPGGSPDRLTCLDNLGTALRTRFDHGHDPSDVDAAVTAHRDMVAALPAGHPETARRLASLGATLRTRYERSLAPGHLDEALFVLTRAAELNSAPPSVRIKAAREAAALAAGSHPGTAAALLETAVLLLPEVAPRHLDRGDQQDALSNFAGLAGDAAALALADPAVSDHARAVRALRLLEGGRAVLLGQALDIRNDLIDLRRHQPGLAARFGELRERLDHAATQIESLGTGWQGRRIIERTQLAEEFAQTLSLIRQLPGFASFARPPAIDDLLSQAGSGPVVTFNISAYRSDALALTSSGVTAITLPDLGHDTLIVRINAFHQALGSVADPRASAADRRAAQRQLSATLEWLWDTAAEPVLRSLAHTAGPAPGADWPRVWWATGGLLGLLPLHAAGYHADPPGPLRRTVLDRVVSSYTPTIRALRRARRPGSRSGGGDRGLVVAMPTTPGLTDRGPLPNVSAEVTVLRKHLPGCTILTEAGENDTAVPTKPNVLTHLGSATIAHFACHGANDPANPSRSRLLLRDHDSDPLTVASLAPVDLDNARLAYLSACSTALTTGSGLIDEAIHLAAAFQLAGFRHVIGTLWEIGDEIAVTIADAFYAHLRSSSHRLDTTRSAHALHHAVRSARDTYPYAPSLWAAYLHAGA